MWSWIPVVLVALMLAEALWIHRTGRGQMGGRQTFSNLALGAGQHLITTALALAPFAGYPWLQRRLGLLAFDTGSWTHWFVAFLALDFVMYWRHRMAHRVGWLWAVHAVHHQSLEYNTSVAVRSSWLQDTILLGVPLAILGVPLDMTLPLWGGAALFTFFQHTELVGRLGVLDRWLMTPSNHRVHHGSNEAYLDSNYGAVLLVWDRLFGTWVPETERVHYGTLAGLPTYDPLCNVLAPFRALQRKAASAPSLWLALQVPFRAPEWGPWMPQTPARRGYAPQRHYRPSAARRLTGFASVAGVVALATAMEQGLVPGGPLLRGAMVVGLLSLALAGAMLDGRYSAVWEQPR